MAHELVKKVNELKDMTTENLGGSEHVKPTPTSAKYDKDKDGKLSPDELKEKYAEDLTTMQEVQLDLLFYGFLNLQQRHDDGEISNDEKRQMGQQLIRKIVTVENSSTVPPPPTLIERAKAKAYENMWTIVLMLILMLYPLIQALVNILMSFT